MGQRKDEPKPPNSSLKEEKCQQTEKQTSIDTNARTGSAHNFQNWNTFIAIKYEYLVTLVVVKKAGVVQNIKWQKFTADI